MVTPYPAVPGDRPNADYVSVKVNGVEVPAVETDMRVGYAHFAFTGKATVEITCREPIEQVNLSPHRLKIPTKTRDRVLTFELTEPRKLHLRVNGLSRFFIFAEAPEANAPAPGQPGVVSLADFGVVSSTETVQTAALQRAIDEAAAQKQTLYVPAGIYRSGRIDLRSNLSLYLAPGAIIKGTAHPADYPRITGGTQQVHIGDAENVRIFGRGVIDGNGQALRRAGGNDRTSRAKLIVTLRSRNLRFEDVVFRDAGVWCLHMIESSDIVARNLKVIAVTRGDYPDGADETGEFLGGNTDAFDPDNSSRVVIDNNFISVDDDAIAVKLRNGTRRDMEDIQFRNNVIWTMCSALKIGTEVNDKTVSNVVFENNDIVHADTGIAVWCWRGGTIENARWENNHFELIGTPKKKSQHAQETILRMTIRDVEGKGHVRNMVIRNNTFEQFGRNPALIQGLDAEHRFEGVLIENLVVDGQRRTTAEDANLRIGAHAEGVTIR